MKTIHIPKGCLLPGLAVLAAAGSALAAPELPPINIGSISTLSAGSADFPSSGLAARAVINSVNATGGIQKRKLVFFEEDDRGKPGTAAEAAARLINESKVVAMVGGASFLDCSVNAAAYQDAGLVSVPGLGLDSRCFNSPMIAPVNAGPYVQLTLGMRYVSYKLKAKRLCVMRLGKPANVQAAFDAALLQWTEKTGIKPVLDERDIQPEDAPEAFFRKASQAACDAIVFGGPGSFATRFARAGKKMMPASVPLVFLGSAYTSQFAEELGNEAEGVYAMSEFEPWSSRSGALNDWRNLMTSSKVPLTSASQGGYVSAQVLVKVLRSIKGEINRDSVTQAFRQMRPYEVTMLGMPFSFGESPVHHPNQAAIPVRLSNGRWRIAHHEWIKPVDATALAQGQ
ncbi:MAG: ABC transporter substrate-binding protein [Pseudomonadota bacterium]